MYGINRLSSIRNGHIRKLLNLDTPEHTADSTAICHGNLGRSHGDQRILNSSRITVLVGDHGRDRKFRVGRNDGESISVAYRNPNDCNQCNWGLSRHKS